MVASSWGEGSRWGVTANRYGVPLWGDENDLELDSGDGWTTLWIH